ncbi:RibD domain-containing protein [Branchiibius hedensis]|uniref:RibD C-terminal domain-containing protein n=1 Tax=Branchiibius hedensis TaxID=672460 RepID=A0A2Y8ZNV4_9MICO|nr:dihydrofolate reductase family protein [Branchiibius hedensis]PWJ24677.1 RibD domain-containing protein [Branchiibius hedensis]SSA33494.1 RibD C-terminal domain-containing protein [Branchiibius hedensis]
MTARARVHNLIVSLDGFSAGEYVTLEQPIGDAQRLFSFFDGRVIHGVDKAEVPITVDRSLFALWGQGIGAEIMGRKKFGPQTGQWPDDGWQGWWGDEPPFATPVFVLTHYPRPPLEFANGTTFHFIDATPQEALRQAKEAAGGLDVRLGGGPSSVRQFLQAGLVDFLHLVVVPITLGRGVRLLEGCEGISDGYDIETVTSATGLTHQLWNRRAQSAQS